MGYAWFIYLLLLLPLPLASVILLTTCGHWSFVRRACRAASSLRLNFGSNSRYHVSLRAVGTTMAVLVFFICTKASHDAHLHQQDYDPTMMTPDRKIQLLAKKWRNERNFWISALVVLLWYVLGGLMRLQEQNAELRAQVLELTAPEKEANKVETKTRKKTIGSKSATSQDTSTTPVEIEMTEAKKDK
mmetsp:Transcript_11165/g.15668  ORF Transcript_11165/g.15668 Transcript_11165/m.15668 type:complete len:188 (-) Transcript_11165:1119-1682(-)